MPISLSKVHRKLLENTTAEARVLAESACKAALENLAVHEKDYRGHMTDAQRVLRNRLRARGRALGDKRDERTGIQGISILSESQIPRMTTNPGCVPCIQEREIHLMLDC